MAKYLQIRPSDLIEIPHQLTNTRFDFDAAVVDFMIWLEGKQEEQKIGKVGKQPGKGETWVPKYATTADIFKEYGDGAHGASQPDKLQVDSDALAAISQAIADRAETQF